MNELIKRTVSNSFYLVGGMFAGYYFGEVKAFAGMLVLVAAIVIFELVHVGLIKYAEGKENDD